ncbi:hypothetical protein EU642_21910 [Salmonella enterica]|nr:hypothetical protein [Salmonella enterica]EAO0118510.1 hypothetical protein [Salmonella enterica]EAO3601615.1 hypothetical protein [Salmonella enterica]EAR6391508.1 hypothetical protein [Salmonella enterica]EAV1285272.1 hypothetical protein [Salmonella enterica]
MWFFGSEAFLSVVQHKTDPAILVVRSRRPGHIQKMFPTAEVVTIDGRDYMYRTELPREAVAERMHKYVMDMTATNFKNSVKDQTYHGACISVWSVMEKIQPMPAYALYSDPNRHYGGYHQYSFEHKPATLRGKRK